MIRLFNTQQSQIPFTSVTVPKENSMIGKPYETAKSRASK